MKKFNRENRRSLSRTVMAARSLLAAGFLLVLAKAWAQSTPPGLTIAPAGTNGLSITITNAILTDSYDIWWTPNLGDLTDFPWTAAAIGTVGQTNFLLPNWQYPAVFFRGILNTNTVPLWEAADPNNPTSVLRITIASPANGAVLQ